jgi:hypothetical protein
VNEPDIALADEEITLKALKKCIDLLLQQARVFIYRNPDSASFKNSLKTEMVSI